jgi:hypothetical protein
MYRVALTIGSPKVRSIMVFLVSLRAHSNANALMIKHRMTHGPARLSFHATRIYFFGVKIVVRGAICAGFEHGRRSWSRLEPYDPSLPFRHTLSLGFLPPGMDHLLWRDG